MQSNCAARKELGQFVFDSFGGHLKVLRIDFHADTVSTPLGGSDICRSRPHERIEDGIAHETEHADQALSEFQWIRC